MTETTQFALECLAFYGLALPIGAAILGATIARLTETEAQKRQRRRDKLRRQNERAMRRELRRHYLDRFV